MIYALCLTSKEDILATLTLLTGYEDFKVYILSAGECGPFNLSISSFPKATLKRFLRLPPIISIIFLHKTILPSS